MAPVADDNNYPNHTFLPSLTSCTFSTCHGISESFDIAVAPHTVGGRTVVTALLSALRAALCNLSAPAYPNDAGSPGDVDSGGDGGYPNDAGSPGAAGYAADAGNPSGGGSMPVCLLTQDALSPTPAAPLTATQVTDNTTFALDNARFTRPPNVLPPSVAGALYNYLLVAKSRDLGVHNPIFTQELLWDSIVAVTGTAPTIIPGLSARPTK